MILYLVNEGSNINAGGACFLAGTVSTLHASGGLSHGLFLSEDSVVVIPNPVFIEVGRIPFEFYFVLSSEFLSLLGADDLRGVKVRGSV